MRFCRKSLVRVVEVRTCHLFIAYFSCSLPLLSTPVSVQDSCVSQLPLRHITVLLLPLSLPLSSSPHLFLSPPFFSIISNNHYLLRKHWMRHFIYYLRNFTTNSMSWVGLSSSHKWERKGSRV